MTDDRRSVDLPWSARGPILLSNSCRGDEFTLAQEEGTVLLSNGLNDHADVALDSGGNVPSLTQVTTEW